jgi:RNA:NAD 2'-phosphotransferase (TPT1/KptA family)
LLQWLAANASDVRVREVALKVMEAWGILSGLGVEDRIEMLKTPERRRISRAMAYHLRHDPDTPMNRTGWVHVDELAPILLAAGHKVTSKQLLVIAGAMGEPRFEISGHDIRAVYGHSLPLAIDYVDRKPPPLLYHGTAASNLASVAEARDGLRRMQRQFVHLTTSRDTALRAASRRGESTVVLEVTTRGLKELKQASEETWLVPRVPVEALRVLPIWELIAPVRQPALD